MKVLSFLVGAAFGIFVVLFLFYSPGAKDLFFGPMISGLIVFVLVLLHPPGDHASAMGANDFVSLWKYSSIVERALMTVWALVTVLIVACAFVMFRERRDDADAGVFFSQATAYIFMCIFTIADINESLRSELPRPSRTAAY
jgi:hypothetical protein